MNRFGMIAALFLTSACAAWGSDSQHIARARGQAWVDMLSGRLPIEQLYETHFSTRFHKKMPASRAQMIFGVLRQFFKGGKATIESMEIGTDAITLQLSNADHRWAEYELQFEPGDAERRLGGFNAQVLGTRPAAGGAVESFDDWLAQAERELERRSKDDSFSGTILIGRGREVLLRKSYGFRDVDETQPIRSDTRFPAASVSKSINALAVAVLVDRGKIALDATIGRYLPDLPNPAIREQVTVAQLLLHTSGVRGMLFADEHPEDVASLEETALAVARRPLSGTPGAAFQYSNGGSILLGYLVERVSGQPYVEFVEQNVFTAAGMSNSGWLYAGHYPTAVAVGTFTGPSGRKGTTRELFEDAINPAAGLYTTAGDLFALNRALYLDGFERSIREVLTAQAVRANSMTEYTTGLMRKQFGQRAALGHTGGLPGVSAQWWFVPEDEISIIVLSNRTDHAAEVADHLLGTLGSITDTP